MPDGEGNNDHAEEGCQNALIQGLKQDMGMAASARPLGRRKNQIGVKIAPLTTEEQNRTCMALTAQRRVRTI